MTTTFQHAVARTAVSNIATAVASAIAGVIIARALGPGARGEYAALSVWLLVAFTVGDLGLTAATTFHVARAERSARAVLATARLVGAGPAVAVLVLGVALAPVLAGHDPALVTGYRLTAVTCCAALLGFACTATLQATAIEMWSVVRAAQPLAYVVVVTGLSVTGDLGLTTALGALMVTTAGQTTLAWWLCRKRGMTGGPADPALAGPLLRYGAGELATSVPYLATARLDQMVLAGTGSPVALGHYAVASSLTGLALPLTSALGHVAFPRLAASGLSDGDRYRLRRRALLAGTGAGLVLTAGLAVTAPWLVPALFGPDFRPAVTLVWILAPAGALLPATRICADLIRGHGRPLAVARVQGGSAVLLAVLLAGLVPSFREFGAAIATSVATALSFVLMLGALRRTVRERVPA